MYNAGERGRAMPKVNQLTVRCENRPGTLAHIAKVMGDADVNILGFLLTTSGSKGHVKLVVDDVEKAKEALEEADLFYAEQAVLHAKLANVPGALGRFARKLAAKNINVTSGYQTIEKDSKRASVVLEVSNLEKAAHVYRSTTSDRLYE
jgi:hypothetical protein